MKQMFIGRMICNDRDLKAMNKITINGLKSILETVFDSTVLDIRKIKIVKGRIAERFYLQCKELGYTEGFFREKQLIVWCQLTANVMDAIYVPFSGEIFLVPQNVCDIENVTADMKLNYPLFQTENFLFSRKFSVTEEERSLWGNMIPAYLEATADVKSSPNGNTIYQEEAPMHYLYNDYV